MNWPAHGSNPHYIYEAMDIEFPEKYIDFSANINPLGPPLILKEHWQKFYDTIIDYPDPYAHTLREKISMHEDVNKDSILIGNGGAELIHLVSRMLSGKRVLLVQPAFSEYEQACQTNGCTIIYHQLYAANWELRIDDLTDKLQRVDAMFVCNPNNPTGVSYPERTIRQLIETCRQSGIHLIIDEAFYDMTEKGCSMLPLLNQYPNLIVIRSLTKMFAIPGLRLGYVIAQPEIIQQLASYQSHWSVNALALAAGDLCLQDDAFVSDTQKYIRDEREKLFSFYEEQKYVVSPSSVNFYLLKDPMLDDQLPLFRFLLKKGIVPRHTVNFPGLEGSWLRFAIKDTSKNEQLMEVLKEWKQQRP